MAGGFFLGLYGEFCKWWVLVSLKVLLFKFIVLFAYIFRQLVDVIAVVVVVAVHHI